MHAHVRPRHPRLHVSRILLTVIAIIGILAAIIIPTVGKVRETAQRTVDASNLREIGKAAMIYAADNNDRLPDRWRRRPSRTCRRPAITSAGSACSRPRRHAERREFLFSKNDSAV